MTRRFKVFLQNLKALRFCLILFVSFSACILVSQHTHAQGFSIEGLFDGHEESPEIASDTDDTDPDVSISEPDSDDLNPAMIDMPAVKLRSLDKISARTQVFEANVGSTVKFGSLYIRVQACRKAPPIEQPESAAFLQVWQLDKEENPVWVFSGWMFASSPGLSSMDHPIYDVWVLDCLAQKGAIVPNNDSVVDTDGIEAEEL